MSSAETRGAQSNFLLATCCFCGICEAITVDLNCNSHGVVDLL